jgi:hypothetical protein
METHVPSDTPEVCKRLKALGYEDHNRMRIYREEWEFISNPVPFENGFAVDGISLSGKAKRVRIPLSVLHMIKRDIAMTEKSKRALLK